MKALIAFIVMAVLVLTLIEVNERIKAKRNKPHPGPPLKGGRRDSLDEECGKDTDGEDCSGCELMDVCEKEEKKKTGR